MRASGPFVTHITYRTRMSRQTKRTATVREFDSSKLRAIREGVETNQSLASGHPLFKIVASGEL